MILIDTSKVGQLKQWVTQNDDGQILADLQRANKYIMYSISRSWMGGIRVTAEEIEQSSKPTWKKATNGLTIGTTIGASLLGGVYVFFEALEIIGKRKLRGE